MLTTIYMSRLQEPGIAVPSNAQLHAALSRNAVIIKKMLNQWNVLGLDDYTVLLKLKFQFNKINETYPLIVTVTSLTMRVFGVSRSAP